MLAIPAQRQRFLFAASVGLACVLSLALGYMLSQIQHRPDSQTAGSIDVYPNNLVIDGKPVQSGNGNSEDAKIESLIVSRYEPGGLKQLSRGKIYYSMPLHDAASVKIYLHTETEGPPKRNSRINALIGLERRGGAWFIAREETIRVE